MLDFASPAATTIGLVGAVLFFATWIPHAIAGRYITVPILYLGGGALIFALPWTTDALGPIEDRAFWERATELVVTVSLFGAGLKIDRRAWPHTWTLTWRLLLVAMPLTIAAVALAARGIAGLPWAACALLGAALAPTDPVLAEDLQVAAPGDGDQGEVKFAITSEAALNDGLAFPFVYAAIALADRGAPVTDWLASWALGDLLYKVTVGVVGGALIGRALAQLIYKWPSDRPFAGQEMGAVAIAAVACSYGITEIVEGYGFLAAFVAGYVVRRVGYHHEYNETLHDFSGNAERALMGVLLVLLGGALPSLLGAHLSWGGAALAALLVFFVRPIVGTLSVVGTSTSWPERLVVGFFGVRGLGSVYYLAYALGVASFARSDEIWAIVAAAILVSSLCHGFGAGPAMAWLERRGESKPAPEP